MALIANNISGSASNASRVGITGSVIFANVPGSSFPSLPGSNVSFFVSGSIGAGEENDKRAVFGGDVRISGSLAVGTGSVIITSNDVQFGTSATKISLVNNSLTFFDSSSPNGKVLALTGAGWELTSSIATQTTTTSTAFSYVSGTVQSFVVPAGVTSVAAYVWAAGGGTGAFSSFRGGAGGFSSGSIAVTPGDTLYIVVGGGGSDNSGGASGPGGLGGWPNAGFGTQGDASGGGGGGYSGIFSGSATPEQVNALLIAGGGGGGTGYKGGGGGGGTTGNAGGNGGNPGLGGTQSAGGTAGNGDTSPPRAGGALTGGNAGGAGQDNPTTPGVNDGGGGGSGYYGGGGGASDGSGGGGGSGFYNTDKVTGGSLQTGSDGQSGALTAPAGTDNQYYVSDIGVGSAYVSGGGNGRIVIAYSSESSVTTPVTYATSSIMVGTSTPATEAALYVTGSIGLSGLLAKKSIFNSDTYVSGSLTTGNLTLTQGRSVNLGRAAASQTTSFTNGVTINSASGVITTVTATTSAGSSESFTVTNSTVSTSSVVLASIGDYSGTYGTNGIPLLYVDSISNGSFSIRVYNAGASNALNGTLKIKFIVC